VAANVGGVAGEYVLEREECRFLARAFPKLGFDLIGTYHGHDRQRYRVGASLSIRSLPAVMKVGRAQKPSGRRSNPPSSTPNPRPWGIPPRSILALGRPGVLVAERVADIAQCRPRFGLASAAARQRLPVIDRTHRMSSPLWP